MRAAAAKLLAQLGEEAEHHGGRSAVNEMTPAVTELKLFVIEEVLLLQASAW